MERRVSARSALATSAAQEADAQHLVANPARFAVIRSGDNEFVFLIDLTGDRFREEDVASLWVDFEESVEGQLARQCVFDTTVLTAVLVDSSDASYHSSWLGVCGDVNRTVGLRRKLEDGRVVVLVGDNDVDERGGGAAGDSVVARLNDEAVFGLFLSVEFVGDKEDAVLAHAPVFGLPHLEEK